MRQRISHSDSDKRPTTGVDPASTGVGTVPGGGVRLMLGRIAAAWPAGSGRVAGSSPGRFGRGRRFLQAYAVVVTFVVLVTAFSVTRTQSFFTTGNLQSLLTSQAALLALTLPLTMTLAAGELDLSIGGQVAMSSVLVGELTGVDHLAAGLAIALSLLAAVAIGLLNALLIVKFRVNGFIATLAIGTLLDGLAQAVSNSVTIGGIPASITSIFGHTVLGVGVSFWYAVVIALIVWYVLTHTATGRRFYFTGEGREAARLAGIRVGRLRVAAFVLSALGAWLAGLILLGQTGAAQAGVGDPYLLPAYAAVFLGAATIIPGRFNAAGTVVAAFLLAVGTTGLQLYGLQTWVTQVFDGSILVLAIVFAASVGVRET